MDNLSDIIVSDCKKFHTRDGEPLYPQKFIKVLKYHSPGLAPALDHTGAYHINIEGEASYSSRYKKTYGYYQNFAAVEDESGWFHIDILGKMLYSHRYQWCGNFQESSCVVKDSEGYYHIDISGRSQYQQRYGYAGDFKDGVAVVMNDGEYFHIKPSGSRVSDKQYLFLDIFHKGFARAQDERGWFHINDQGEAIYLQRYKMVEPFYNDFALVQTFCDSFLRINIKGRVIETIKARSKNYIGELSGKLIGFWSLYVINAAIKLDLLDALPGNIHHIASTVKLPLEKCQRLLKGLWELDVVTFAGGIWDTTTLGKLLVKQNGQFMHDAAVMWQDVEKQWHQLENLLLSNEEKHRPCFKENADIEKYVVYQSALTGYANSDFEEISNYMSFNDEDHIAVVGNCAEAIIEKICQVCSSLKITYLNIEGYLRRFDFAGNKLLDVEKIVLNSPWVGLYDCIMFPRFLHSWPDNDVRGLLAHATKALTSRGKMYVMETVINDDSPRGAFLDLNMMVESGGKLRTKASWRDICKTAKLKLESTVNITPYLQLMTFIHE